MDELLHTMTGMESFIPHGHCYLWRADLLWLHAVSDGLIAAAYFSLPAALIYFVSRRRDLAFRSVFVMFGVFILACGLTHVMGVWTIWTPAYWLDGGIKAVTAATSVATAILIWPLIPQALALPSPAQLELANRELRHEVIVRTAAEQALRERDDALQRMNEALETRVEQRTRALLDAQDELMRREKLALLGQVAGSVGHELRNPLGVMSNAVYFLKTVLAGTDATTREYLDIISYEIDSAERIVAELLDSVRTRPPQPEPMDTEYLIRQALTHCNVPAEVELQIDTPGGLPPVVVDAQQMQRVLHNLIANAIDAMSGSGRLSIRAAEDRDAATVRLSVVDTGVGMTPEQLAKLFQPLFTTKPRGIGLGLVVVKNLVEANGGRIEVQSTVGAGSTFTLILNAGAMPQAVA